MKPAILLALVMSLVTGQARAQYDDDSLRHVVWVSVTAGGGVAHLTCDTCRNASEGGMDLIFAMGGVRSAHIRYGVTLDMYEGQRSTFGSATLSVSYYPWQDRSLFLEGGFGGAFSCFRAYQGGGSASASGIALVGAVGTDIRLQPRVYFKPRIAMSYAAIGDVADNSVPSSASTRRPGWGQTVLSFGIGVQWEY